MRAFTSGAADGSGSFVGRPPPPLPVDTSGTFVAFRRHCGAAHTLNKTTDLDQILDTVRRLHHGAGPAVLAADDRTPAWLPGCPPGPQRPRQTYGISPREHRAPRPPVASLCCCNSAPDRCRFGTNTGSDGKHRTTPRDAGTDGAMSGRQLEQARRAADYAVATARADADDELTVETQRHFSEAEFFDPVFSIGSFIGMQHVGRAMHWDESCPVAPIRELVERGEAASPGRRSARRG